MTDTIAPAQVAAKIPLRRKWPFVALLNIIPVLVPIGQILLWSGPVYSRRKGQVVPARRRDKLGLTVLAVISLVYGINQLAALSGLAELPACGSRAALSTLKDAIAHSPAGKLRGLEALDVQQVGQTNWSETAQVRSCTGVVLLNDGSNTKTSFRLSWLDRGQGTWSLEFNM